MVLVWSADSSGTKFGLKAKKPQWCTEQRITMGGHKSKPSSLFPNPKTILLAGKFLAEKKSMRMMAHALVSERAKEVEIMSGNTGACTR